MTGPDRIWAWISNYKPQGVSLSGGPPDDTIGYIRHDPAVLAALPEVQALIQQTVKAEPVAWSCEENRIMDDGWTARLFFEKPEAGPRYRNITPLYAQPPVRSEQDEARVLKITAAYETGAQKVYEEWLDSWVLRASAYPSCDMSDFSEAARKYAEIHINGDSS